MRGPYPGLGAALTAFGVQQGNFMAYDIASELADNEDPWPEVERAFKDPSLLGMGLERRISNTLIEMWQDLSEERLALLKLLSRFDLTVDQAIRFYQETEREAAQIFVDDAHLLANPYLLYELDRFSTDPISLSTVDKGIFPDEAVRQAHPLPERSSLGDDPLEKRRVRAFIVSVLEQASSDGSTLQSQNDVVQTIRDLPLQPSLPVSKDLMPVVERIFPPVLKRVELADGKPAYQLSRLSEMGEIIRREVQRRLKGRRHEIEAEWATLLEEKLRDTASQAAEAEQRAREEKVAALEELAASRVAVLIGPAGTGKPRSSPYSAHYRRYKVAASPF